MCDDKGGKLPSTDDYNGIKKSPNFEKLEIISNGFWKKENFKLSQFQYFVDVKYNFETKKWKDNNDHHIKQEQWHSNNGNRPVYPILNDILLSYVSSRDWQ